MRLPPLPGSQFLSNLAALYGIQLATLFLPLLSLPYLTRVLQPAAWGQLGAITSLSFVLLLLVEYGFQLSATRDVARHRDEPRRLARIVAGVQGAKAILLLLMLGAALIVYALIPVVRETPAVYWCGVAFAAAQGFSPFWYFQGVERVQRAAALDMAARGLAVAGVFVFVHGPQDAYRVLALQAVCSLLAVAWNTGRMYREVPLRLPRWPEALGALRAGWTLFVFRGGVALYTSANAFVLRLFLPAASVANFVNAERLANAGKSLLQPVSQLLFPRVTHLIQSDRPRARHLTARSLMLMTAVGCLGAGLAFMLAPLIVPVVFGPGYERSVNALRILSLSIPFVAVSNVLGLQWMLPLGLDRVFNGIIISAGVLNIALAVLLVRAFGLTGMSGAVVVSEGFAAVAMLLYLARAGLLPLSRTGRFG
ncbi:oligosaccharide flippase family protein [Deinococcus peraridilitoris]|uniref:Membrane protein involved in the export of O-antigen and teichoic acid n=1 Tax=Deinococcus peraridilitoris (strain DSM 19664 / LMG 22246 / CIP 109416 / KR-200) TaxID=937777 RepID=K9ZZZ6_DEIPD|nr:oligosaccharide flippase family protein [Deinococcus peraridilitoris]AFZ66507.1 membrane protein involved in the export of O-antigen and teichoic acid [Deinococcus peraridilitoris DSM 19664]